MGSYDTPETQQAYAQGYQVGYNHGLQAGGEGGAPGKYPVDLVARYPESSSRLLMFFMLFKPILLIPHLVIMWVLGIASAFAVFVAWWAVVITGRYPRSIWDFVTGVMRWQTRISFYMLGLRDEYPPFSLQ
ncbi:MAG TPA: DUF4389 domain-containing protein [Symbiobacteriaceae bacterium]|jgi:hypothetical protein